MKNKRQSVAEATVKIVVCMIILLPMLSIVVWAFSERWAWPDLLPQKFSVRAFEAVLSNKDLAELIASSVFISGIVAMLSGAISVMTARALTLYEFKGKGLFQFMAILPFLVPVTVFAMGIHVSFIRWGLSNNIFGVIISHTICSLPYAVQLVNGGTQALGTSLEEQARVLGAGPWKAFFKVTLPLLTPGIISGMSMAFVVSLSQYFLTLLLGGGQVKTFAIVMVPYLQSVDRNIACIYSLLFLVVTIVVFGGLEWIVGRLNKNNTVVYY